MSNKDMNKIKEDHEVTSQKEKPQIKTTDNFKKAANKLEEKGYGAMNKAKEGKQWLDNRLEDTFDIILQKGLGGGEPELRSGDGSPQNNRRNSQGDILNKKGSGERKENPLKKGVESKVSTGGLRGTESKIAASDGKLGEVANVGRVESKVGAGKLRGTESKIAASDGKLGEVANVERMGSKEGAGRLRGAERGIGASDGKLGEVANVERMEGKVSTGGLRGVESGIGTSGVGARGEIASIDDKIGDGVSRGMEREIGTSTRLSEKGDNVDKIGNNEINGKLWSIDDDIEDSSVVLGEGAKLENNVNKESNRELGNVNEVEGVIQDNGTKDIANPRNRRDSGIGLSEDEEESISVRSNTDINSLENIEPPEGDAPPAYSDSGKDLLLQSSKEDAPSRYDEITSKEGSQEDREQEGINPEEGTKGETPDSVKKPEESTEAQNDVNNEKIKNEIKERIKDKVSGIGDNVKRKIKEVENGIDDALDYFEDFIMGAGAELLNGEEVQTPQPRDGSSQSRSGNSRNARSNNRSDVRKEVSRNEGVRGKASTDESGSVRSGTSGERSGELGNSRRVDSRNGISELRSRDKDKDNHEQVKNTIQDNGTKDVAHHLNRKDSGIDLSQVSKQSDASLAETPKTPATETAEATAGKIDSASNVKDKSDGGEQETASKSLENMSEAEKARLKEVEKAREKDNFVGMFTSLAKSPLQEKIAREFGENAYDELAKKDEKGIAKMMNDISYMRENDPEKYKKMVNDFTTYLQGEEERIKAERNMRKQWQTEMPMAEGIAV